MTDATTSSPSLTVFRVFRGFPSEGQFTWSPFVTKLEARLRFADLKYKTDAGSLSKAPMGKIPYMNISPAESNGAGAPSRTLADTTLIINALVEEGITEDLNTHLSPAEKAHDMALRALLEDKLYFYQNYERWHENYYAMRDQALWSFPAPMRIVLGLLAYRAISATLQGQGTSRFPTETISSFRQTIWENVNALAVEARKKARPEKEPFWILGGSSPTEADATVFGFVAGAIVCGAAPETKRVVKGYPALVDYGTRIHDKYFPDYEWI